MLGKLHNLRAYAIFCIIAGCDHKNNSVDLGGVVVQKLEKESLWSGGGHRFENLGEAPMSASTPISSTVGPSAIRLFTDGLITDTKQI